MGLYKRNDSSVYWIAYTFNGIKYNKSTNTSDIKTAEKIEKMLQAKIALGQWHPESQERKVSKIEYTFKELTDKYFAWIDGRQASAQTKRYAINKHLSKYNPVLLDNITPNMIEQLQTDLMKQNQKPASINKITNIVKHMMNKAAQWDMCKKETHRKLLGVKNLKGEGKRLRYLSLTEIQSLLDACDDKLRPIVIIALNTGMRKGEILGLKWEQVDFKHNRILLDRTKNGERREVPINSVVREVLQSLIRRLDIPYVFFNPATGTRYERSLKKSFLSACKRANIKDFHFHDLRHTFASQLVMLGVDITTVSKLLGHKSLTMTLRYSHLSQGHLDSAVTKLSDVLDSKTAIPNAQKN